MKIEISNGELLDKISILELKMLKIEDKEKLVNIEKEFHTLNPLCVKLFEKFGGELQNHYLELAAINAELSRLISYLTPFNLKEPPCFNIFLKKDSCFSFQDSLINISSSLGIIEPLT